MDKKASELDMVFNTFPIGNETINELARTHRTIQQNITRFCIRWIERMAEEQWVDGRNEDSVNICKDLMKIEGVREVLGRPMPYI